MLISLIKNRKGFSLLELVIVIALFMLIGGISVPAFANWLHYNDLKKSALIFEDILNKAKDRAKETQQNVKVVIKDGTNGKKIDILDGLADSLNCLEMFEESLYVSYLLEAEITEENGNYKMCFSPTGASQSMSFKIHNNKNFFIIKINENTGFIEKIS
jgi:prepilin-type N-terminal cleavage/methylation domain-containing protein